MKAELQASGLLLISRVLSIGLNLATQILTIHYLSTENYGVLAIALVVLGSATALPVFGLDKALTRVLPGLVVHGDGTTFDRTLRFTLHTVGIWTALLSVAGLLLIFLLESSPNVMLALLALFVMLPLGAGDRVLEGLLAALRRSDEIARRKYLYRPVTRLLLVGAAVLIDGGLPLVAAAHSLTLVIGLVFYLTAVRRALRANPLPAGGEASDAAREELIAYARPQYGSDLTLLVQAVTIPALVTAVAGTASMAAYAAVLPFARLNQLVIEAFAPVYTPGASRLLAQHRSAEVNVFFWRTACWVVAITFPMLAMTTIFGDVLLMTFLDERYRESVLLLTICSIGYFCQGAFGFTNFQLRLEGHGGAVFRADVALVLFEALLALLLVTQWGALGAALALAVSLTAHGALKRYLVQRHCKLILTSGFRSASVRVYLPAAGLLLVLGALEAALQPGLVPAIGLTAFAWLILLRWAKPELAFGEYFLFLRRLPGASWVV